MAPFWVTGQEHTGILCSYLCFQKWFKSSQHSFSTGTFYEMSSWQMSVELRFTTLLIKGPKVLAERPEQQVWFLLGHLAKEGPNYCCFRPLLAGPPAHSSIRGRGRGFRPDWAINALLFPTGKRNKNNFMTCSGGREKALPVPHLAQRPFTSPQAAPFRL